MLSGKQADVYFTGEMSHVGLLSRVLIASKLILSMLHSTRCWQQSRLESMLFYVSRHLNFLRILVPDMAWVFYRRPYKYRTWLSTGPCSEFTP